MLQEAFAVRQEPRRQASRTPPPASGAYIHRSNAPLAELKAANESQSSQTTLKPIQPQPLE